MRAPFVLAGCDVLGSTMHGQTPEPSRCPLCAQGHTRALARAHGRDYFECVTCGLVFVAPEQRLTPEAERAHYGTHENDPNDPGYRAFLERLAAPLAARLPPGARGLDFGSGPGPTLSSMLEQRGYVVDVYDPFFAPDTRVLSETFDFITCTEAAEHFYEPGREFSRLDGLLRPGGWIGLMTELVPEERAFGDWYYPRDPTHVVFYRRSTLAWLEHRLGWTLRYEAPRVFLFQKAQDG